MIKKSRLFVYGGCDLLDIVKDDLLQRDYEIIDHTIDTNAVDNSDINFTNGSFPNSGSSIISIYTKPGAIAQRVLDTLSCGTKRDMIINRAIYNEIVKFPYLEFYKKNAGPNDYLLMGFSPELYTKFFRARECFSCIPPMGILTDPTNCLHWLYKEYFTKDNFLLPFDTKESLEWTFDLMPDFARDIYEIFQDRVILVKTHFSNFVITADYKVQPIVSNPSQLLFYRQTKVISDPTDFKYADRLSSIIMNKFLHHYGANLDLVKLDEPVFVDANHRWGFSQFHIDIGSRNKLAKLIHENIVCRKLKEVGHA
jgi:hypothetical protein